MRKNLPIGIQTLAKIRQDGYLYVDKTAHALALAEKGGYYFLSRPRRFGKSLFLDTLHQLFACRRELFTGLYAEDKWDWDAPRPVITISFSDGVLQSRAELDRRIRDILRVNRERLAVHCDDMEDVTACLAELIRRTREKYGRRVVVLVDEYDKPILDNIEDPAMAAVMREGLKNLYSVLKGQDAELRFVLLTGVSKFSKVSLFSGLNNLEDITLNPAYATICGYTHADVVEHLGEHLAGVDMEELRRWYNGYSWLGEPVYNPFDILLFISNSGIFRSYWFETGSPSFLIKLFRKNKYFLPDLEDVEAGDALLDSFDVDHIDPVALLFQTGYLTIREMIDRRGRPLYRLGFPNLEVRYALSERLITGYAGFTTAMIPVQDRLFKALEQGDTETLRGEIFRLFAAIPYRNFSAGDLPDYEGYYASVLYAFFASLGVTIIPEDISNHGQVDMTVQTAGQVYVLELKVVDATELTGENPALSQILSRDYAAKYRGAPGVSVHEIGAVFSRQTRNLIAWDAAPM